MNQTVNQADQALAAFSPLGDEAVSMTRVDFLVQEPEEVLTCPGYPNEIRWRPGERLNHLFEERFPLLGGDGGGRLAVTAEDGDLSYDGLDQKANQLARYLIELGVRQGDRVGLLFSRSIWSYVAMLAVMKANAAYVPLDPGFPKDRIAFISEDANIRLFLTTSSLSGHLDGLPENIAPEVVCLDQFRSLIERQSTDALDLPASAATSDLCYIIYTSGSTGKPKGVAVEHCSICNFVRAAAEVYGFSPEDRVYQGMTIAFDFSVEEIWVPLYSGATLVAAPAGPSLVGNDLSQFLEARRITALCCVPTLLATLDNNLPLLRLILVSGEACPQNLVERWYREDRTFLNVYGPTEATVTATWTLLAPDKPVTIGVPLPTYRLLILAPEASRLVEKGGIGEICIAGIGLAVGYVNRPDLTEKAFIPDFLGLPDNPTARIYRTGDLGRITENGEIEYLGRLDAQVKIRGYRIELAEIESVIMRVPGIAQAVVNTFQPEPGMVELVAYYTLRQDVTHLDRETIVEAIRGDLPAYMLPAFFERMDALPMLPSDKVDRKSLPPPSGPRHSARKAHHIAPENDTERAIAQVLMGLLKIEQVSMDDHFFNDLGANSLLMARFCAQVRERLDYSDVSMREVYLHPTPRDFASFLTTQAHRKSPTAQTEPAHVASNMEYWLCGGLQTIFFILYSTAIIAGTVEGYAWISETAAIGDLYLRSLAFSSGMLFTLMALPVAVKWLVIGRWREERIPVWSLRYFRFWLVRRLIQTNPMIMFIGSPLYNVYLRLLGAKIGRNVVNFSRVVPACPDLLSIGDGTIIRKDSNLVGYRARSGFIETGKVTIGKNAFIGEATVLDIGTSIGDGAQLGHTSSLHQGQTIPAGKRYHGSPARETTDNYLTVEPRPCGLIRRAAYAAGQLAVLGLTLPLPIVVFDFLLNWLGFGTGSELASYANSNVNTLGFQLNLAAVSAGVYIGMIAFGLLSITTIPRLFNLFLKEGKTYTLYGFHFLLHQAISSRSNSYFYNLLFGDSSYIIYYLRAIGYKISLKDQTGSNFGVEQKQDTPFLCEIGKGTLISDGISLINADTSNSSFRLRKVSIGANSFIGNNVFYSAESKVGENCLLGTKTMVPISGPVLKNVGLLGSPPFEIPRSVARDKQLEHYRDGPTFKDRLFRKNISNTITMILFMATQWFFVHLVTLLGVIEIEQFHDTGWTALLDFTLIVLAVTVAYYALLERASIGFAKLKPQSCSIYDDYYWKHERFWKLSEVFYLELFAGTPFKGLVWRLLGVKVGKKLFDDGSGIPEKSLVSIGDYCTINQMVTIQGHSLEDGAFKSDYIRIGNGCTIGCNAFVHYGVEMEDNVVLEPDSFLMKGEHLAANSTWRGNPAREI